MNAPRPMSGHDPRFRAALLGPRYWPTWLLFLLCGLAAAVPMRGRSLVGRVVGRAAGRLPGRRPRIARVNLSLCFPRLDEAERERLLARHARIVTDVFLDYGRLLFGSSASLERMTDVSGLEHLDAAAGTGGGVLVLTAHTAAMEHTGQWLNRRHRLVSIVRLHRGNDLLDWMVTRMRTRHGAAVISHDAGLLPLIRAVRSGNWLYYLPDEDPGAGHGTFAPLFGVEKATVTSLGRLAAACRATVLPMAGGYCPERRRFWVRFLEPVPWGDVGEPRAEATRINRLLEQIIETDPAQYMWTNKLFRTRPAGTSKPY